MVFRGNVLASSEMVNSSSFSTSPSMFTVNVYSEKGGTEPIQGRQWGELFVSHIIRNEVTVDLQWFLQYISSSGV